MAESFQVLGQNKPLAGVLTTLYSVPTSNQAVVSSVIVCNQSNVIDLFRISLAVAAAADDPSQYLAYDSIVLGNDSLSLTWGIGLAAGTVVRVYSRYGNVSFNAFGTQLN